MGCNCGQSTPPPPVQPVGETQQFALKLNDGRVYRFGSRLEAEAENVRRGYTGTVKPA